MKNEPNNKNNPDELDGWDATTDGIDPAHYEQPPRLTPEDEAILDRVWAEIRQEKQAQRGAPGDGESSSS